MNNKQNGFSTVEILAVIIVIGLLGVMGWLVYTRQNGNYESKNTPSQTTQQEEKQEAITKESKESVTAPPKIDTAIHEVDIKMQTAADIGKLPEYTPASFRTYMLDVLQKNSFYHNSVDGIDTIAQYQISKISQVNIIGGQVPVDKNGEGHPGGAPAIWVLAPTGAWDQETLNGPICVSKNGGLVYEEFVKECSDSSGVYVKNPNGSIKSLAQ